MKRKIRDIAAAFIGLCLISAGYTKRAKQEIKKNNYITGIYFHNPHKRLFEKCIKWLKLNGFTIITSEELAEIINKKKQAVPYSVWVSFDDGWQDNMKNVVPFAAENKIPLTFFITTEPVEQSGEYWWRLAEENQELLQEPYNSNINKLWEIPESKRAEIISELKSKLSNVRNREAMTVEDIKKIAGYDFFTVGSHTVNHVITTNCTDEELDYELSESKRKLEQWTGKQVDFFCYPNGNFSVREENILKKNGYKFAAAAENDFITRDTSPYKITRFSIGEGYFYEELCHMLGVWQKVMKRLKS